MSKANREDWEAYFPKFVDWQKERHESTGVCHFCGFKGLTAPILHEVDGKEQVVDVCFNCFWERIDKIKIFLKRS